MSTRKQSAISRFFGIVGSAIAVASATEGGYRAKASDLRRLGIDPVQFGKIGR